MKIQGTPAGEYQNVKVRIGVGATKSYIDVEIDAALDYNMKQATAGMQSAC